MDLCLSTLSTFKARQPGHRVVPTQCPVCRRWPAFAVARQELTTVRPKRKKTPTGSHPDILPGFSVTHRTVTSLRSRTVPSPTARKATVLLKESFLTGVAVAIVCARQLLSWQCPKGHFQDCRLSPTAHGRFLLSGLPPFSRYSLTPNRRLFTLREVYHSVFTVSALSLRYSPLKSFRTPFCCKDSFSDVCIAMVIQSGLLKNLHTYG